MKKTTFQFLRESKWVELPCIDAMLVRLDTDTKKVFKCLFSMAKMTTHETPLFEYCWITHDKKLNPFLAFHFKDSAYKYQGHISKQGAKYKLELSRMSKKGNIITHELLNSDYMTFRTVSVTGIYKKIKKPLNALNH